MFIAERVANTFRTSEILKSGVSKAELLITNVIADKTLVLIIAIEYE